jgi:transposase-like protein
MDRDWLSTRLEQGRSIESLAREHGRDPSTVAYWVNKHGLASAHAAKHAPRGGLARETLQVLVEEGLSMRQIGSRLGVSGATVRHWLRKHGLQTVRSAHRVTVSAPADAQPGDRAPGHCREHGAAVFVARAGGGWRCLKCRADAVTKRRRLVKATLVAEAGGRCALCGYTRSVAALQFHHLDPEAKEFQLSHRGMARSLAAARAEADKCALLCANCHAEVEAGVATL